MSRFMRGLFQTARTISTIDPTALTGTPGGPSPSPGWNVCTIVFWRVVWYLRGRDRINVVPGYRAWPWPSCLCCLWTCRRRVVATRRRTLVFAMVYMVSVLSWFAI